MDITIISHEEACILFDGISHSYNPSPDLRAISLDFVFEERFTSELSPQSILFNSHSPREFRYQNNIEIVEFPETKTPYSFWSTYLLLGLKSHKAG